MSNTSTPRTESPAPTTSAPGTASHKHALTAVEKQRSQLERLLKDPAKPVYIPPPPKEKTIRPPREMMKNVQGSSAGAGSGEFHVYKAGRRREAERLKLLQEEAEKEQVTAEFERRRREQEEAAEAKTAKNRAKRQKKKAAQKKGAAAAKDNAGSGDEDDGEGAGGKSNKKAGGDDGNSAPLKKRRLINGQELVFKKPGEEDGDDGESGGEEVGPQVPQKESEPEPAAMPIAVVENKITIIEDD